MIARTPVLDAEGHMRAMARRTTLIRQWQLFLEQYPLVLCPVSGEPPFPWGWDVESETTMARVVRAQVAAELKTGSAAPLVNAHLYGPQFLTDRRPIRLRR